MPNLREHVESVLRANQVVCQTTFAAPGTTGQMVRDKLVDDLCALVPQPSREGCHEILRHADFSDQEGVAYCIDRLMAWAAGQEERRWCKDISWDGDCWVLRWDGEKDIGLPGSVGSCRVRELSEGWAFCPICAAPRPGSP